MPLEWRTTKVNTSKGEVTVEHWAKHNPIELLEAVSDRANPVSGQPMVFKHIFRGRQLASRFMPQHSNDWIIAYYPPSTLFATLKEMARKRIAIVELPVASIKRPNGTTQIVTAWKKSYADLDLFLRSKEFSTVRKLKVGLAAMRLVAKLHAAGYNHSHIKMENILVSEHDVPHLIDYTFLNLEKRLYSLEKGDTKILAASMVDTIGKSLGGKQGEKLTFQHKDQFLREYYRARQRYKATFEKRARSGR
ncbi:MAG: hypothetical protein V1722_01820 [Candidatus Micrarchaeota archaeon]